MRRKTRRRSRKGFRRSGSWALPDEENIVDKKKNMYGTVDDSARMRRRRASGVLQGAVRRA
eukprot:476620-Heterocapsa_arctica.AAC.1